ncbi:MAG: hypothetical protein CMJ95_01635 [Planctomycetes bacterium]|nr:hypothetical protein [Planctomycetota bacterium]
MKMDIFDDYLFIDKSLQAAAASVYQEDAAAMWHGIEMITLTKQDFARLFSDKCTSEAWVNDEVCKCLAIDKQMEHFLECGGLHRYYAGSWTCSQCCGQTAQWSRKYVQIHIILFLYHINLTAIAQLNSLRFVLRLRICCISY